jgi:hypothetical protein
VRSPADGLPADGWRITAAAISATKQPSLPRLPAHWLRIVPPNPAPACRGRDRSASNGSSRAVGGLSRSGGGVAGSVDDVGCGCLGPARSTSAPSIGQLTINDQGSTASHNPSSQSRRSTTRARISVSPTELDTGRADLDAQPGHRGGRRPMIAGAALPRTWSYRDGCARVGYGQSQSLPVQRPLFASLERRLWPAREAGSASRLRRAPASSAVARRVGRTWRWRVVAVHRTCRTAAVHWADRYAAEGMFIREMLLGERNEVTDECMRDR